MVNGEKEEERILFELGFIYYVIVLEFLIRLYLGMFKDVFVCILEEGVKLFFC